MPQVPDPDLGRHTGYLEMFHGFLQYLQGNGLTVTCVIPWSLSSMLDEMVTIYNPAARKCRNGRM
jgi:hypothetical protein